MLKQYKEAIEKTNIISKTDINGVITFVNDEFCKISGYTKEELLSQKHNIVRHPDVPDSKFKELWKAITSKHIYKGTVKNLAKDGTSFFVNTTVIPILDKNGNIAEFIAIRYDVTKEMFYKQALEKKEKELEELNQNLEEKVQAKTKELKELNETLELRVSKEIAKNEEKQQIMFWQSRLASMGEMLANIAHQWRQPLTELTLTMFSLKKAALSDDEKELKKLYSDSQKIVQNMSQTIDDFSNFFKPSKKKYKFKLRETLHDSVNILDKLIVSQMVDITLHCEDIELLGIRNELSQVIINLVKNSVDAFVNNSILIREIDINARVEHENALITIEDNAGGIKLKEKYKIFEPYFTTKHANVGTGLGLFMSKMICEKGFQGSIDVISKNNTTRFIIKIPLSDEIINEK